MSCTVVIRESFKRILNVYIKVLDILVLVSYYMVKVTELEGLKIVLSLV